MNLLIAVPSMISAELLITSLFCEGLSTSLFASTCIPNILCLSHVVCKQTASLNPEENFRWRYMLYSLIIIICTIFILILSCFKSFSASLQPIFFLGLSCCLHVFYSTICQSFADWSTGKALNILYICINRFSYLNPHHPY